MTYLAQLRVQGLLKRAEAHVRDLQRPVEPPEHPLVCEEQLTPEMVRWMDDVMESS